MNKLIQNGKVAVIVSCMPNNYWWTAADCTDIDRLFDPGLAELILAREAKNDEASINNLHTYFKLKYPEEDNIVEYLTVAFIPENKLFIVLAIDSCETIIYKENIDWIKA